MVLEFCRCFDICGERGDSLILFYNSLYDLSMHKILVSWKVPSRILYLIFIRLVRSYAFSYLIEVSGIKRWIWDYVI